jgi:hypothetical protein
VLIVGKNEDEIRAIIKLFQFTILLAQLLLANASGLALKAKPIPNIYPMASRKASLLLK